MSKGATINDLEVTKKIKEKIFLKAFFREIFF